MAYWSPRVLVVCCPRDPEPDRFRSHPVSIPDEWLWDLSIVAQLAGYQDSGADIAYLLSRILTLMS